MKTALIRSLRFVAGRWPRFGFGLARVLAWLSRPLGRGIPEERLAQLFPHLRADALTAARRETWRHFLQEHAFEAALARPGAAPRYPRTKVDPRLEQLSPPLVLASFHIGPIRAIGPVLERLDGEVLVLHRGQFAPRPGLTLVRTGDDEWTRARAFKRAVETLRGGGYVYLAMDGFGEQGYDGSTLEVPLLGGSVALARGGFALARMTGTPLVPVVGTWRGSRAEIVCGDPIPPSGDEHAMAASLAHWLERRLLEAPGEISSRTVEIVRPPAR